MNFFSDEISIMTLLERYIKNYTNTTNIRTFKQNSELWKQNRRHTIGSSELRDATGTENQREKIIKRKLGLGTDINRMKAIVWGTVLEPLTSLVTSILLGHKIFNINGSIPCDRYIDKNGKPTNSDSPDGLGVVMIPTSFYNRVMPVYVEQLSIYGKASFDRKTKKEEVGKIITPILFGKAIAIDICEEHELPENVTTYIPPVMTEGADEIELIAHYEFKSPVSRNIELGKMSDAYLFQKLSGTDIIPCCNVGVFSEIRFETTYKFQNIPVVLIDSYRTFQTHYVYFAMTLYTRLLVPHGPTTRIVYYSPMDDYGPLSEYTPVEDFEMLCGPYMYNFGDGYVFCNEGFESTFGFPEPDIKKPTNLEEFNQYCDSMNSYILTQDELLRVQTHTKFEVAQVGINTVRKVMDFVKNLHPLCVDLLEEVERRRQ